DDLVSALCAELIETLRLQGCSFERPPFVGDLPRMAPSGAVSGTRHFYTRDGFELPREGVELPVVAGGQTVGRFVLVPTVGAGVDMERRLVAVALAHQLRVVLGRLVP